MFGFEPTAAKILGSSGRYEARIRKFRDARKRLPVVQHKFWWVFHNCVAHMLLGISPCQWSFRLHDWTSRKLNAE